MHAEIYWKDTSEEVRKIRLDSGKADLVKLQLRPQSSYGEFWSRDDSSELSQIETRGPGLVFLPQQSLDGFPLRRGSSLWPTGDPSEGRGCGLMAVDIPSSWGNIIMSSGALARKCGINR